MNRKKQIAMLLSVAIMCILSACSDEINTNTQIETETDVLVAENTDVSDENSLLCIQKSVDCTKAEATEILNLLVDYADCKDIVWMGLLVDNNVYRVEDTEGETFRVMIDNDNGYQVQRIDNMDGLTLYKA